MGIGPYLAVRGGIIGCMVVILLCWMATANLPTANLATQPPPSNGLGRGDPAEGDEKCIISSDYSQNILQWCDYIVRYSESHGLDPDLVAAVMLMESGGNSLAYSRSGAVGLMQVMPRDGIAATFTCSNGPCFASRPTIEELQDPEYNIEYGTRMLAGLLARLGNLRDALRAYGPRDVGYDYADKVLAIYERYQQ